MTISLGETVSVRNIVDIKEKLRTYISNVDQINIDITECSEIDLSALQLIEATRIHAANSGKPISLTSPANAVVGAVLARAGFTERMTPEDRHFWFHKEG